MKTEITGSEVVLAWGVTSGLGWIATIFLTGITQILAAWTALMAVPIGMTAYLYMDGRSNRLLNMWSVLVSAVMVQNYIVPLRYGIYSYLYLWIIAGLAGYIYTYRRLPPPSQSYYRYAAYLSAASLPLIAFDYRLTPVIGVIAQGLPMIHDYRKVHM